MKNIFAIVALSACLVIGCTEFEEPMPVQNTETLNAELRTRAGEPPVFEKMENPYSLERMRRLTNNPNLQHTHIYGRFLPADSAQLNLLEDRMQLDLFDFPLDVDIEDDEDYVDSTIPEGEFTWQYTVVPANFVFPTGITWEKLEDAYIPTESEETPTATRAPGDVSNLEMAAILDCGYTIPPATRADSGTPEGRVTVYDDVRNSYEPVKGVRVKCWYFLKSANDYTDTDGNYSISKKFYVTGRFRCQLSALLQ
jgi:hypothetical protein